MVEDIRTEDTYLRWDYMGKGVFACFNHESEAVGELQLEMVGEHLHWCWYQFDNVRMSPGCLQEVRDKQKELWKKRSKEHND